MELMLIEWIRLVIEVVVGDYPLCCDDVDVAYVVLY